MVFDVAKWLWETEGELADFTSVILLCAPNDFFEEDYLEDEQQLNLDRAFLVLNESVKRIYASKEKLRDELLKLSDESYIAFQNGDEDLGARKIRELRVSAGFFHTAD